MTLQESLTRQVKLAKARNEKAAAHARVLSFRALEGHTEDLKDLLDAPLSRAVEEGMKNMVGIVDGLALEILKAANRKSQRAGKGNGDVYPSGNGSGL